jgi:hypothetical protein
MSWGTKRRLLVIGVFLLLLAMGIAFVLYPIFVKTPTCFDNIKNGLEERIDCGGNCAKLCSVNLAPLSVTFARFFPGKTNEYDALAYVVNQNPRAAVKNISYRFKLYDERGSSIIERTGSTPVYANTVTPIFESAIRAGNKKPIRVTFDFSEEPTWYKIPQEGVHSGLAIALASFQKSSGIPIVRTTVKNETLKKMIHPGFVVSLYNDAGTVYAGSKTYLDSLLPDETKGIFFSWNTDLPPPSRIEILPIIDQFAQ